MQIPGLAEGIYNDFQRILATLLLIKNPAAIFDFIREDLAMPIFHCTEFPSRRMIQIARYSCFVLGIAIYTHHHLPVQDPLEVIVDAFFQAGDITLRRG